MPKTFAGASDDVYQMARDLIAEHHPELRDWKLVILFETNWDAKGFLKYPKPNKHGKVRLGHAKCFSEADRVAGAPAFLITILSNWWDKAEADERRALLHHEICHCGVEEVETEDGCSESKPMLVPHDLEEFHLIARLEGAWDWSVRTFEAQLKFHYDGDDAPTPAHDPETGEIREGDAGGSISARDPHALAGQVCSEVRAALGEPG